MVKCKSVHVCVCLLVYLSVGKFFVLYEKGCLYYVFQCCYIITIVFIFIIYEKRETRFCCHSLKLKGNVISSARRKMFFVT